ncbi:YjgN family protein [Sphingomicrobium flavum]|uniref:YjgN family protein n=1 Tax=Sphingomicrobium flavum TaxID=1229164 RepID=UPI0021ADE7D2|nr:YjgN family protein [Sphingomicrobium flavum]
MNAPLAPDAPREPASAIHFTGNWKEFLPIAATNFLLTIVTLGIYRFWAKARERRYLWSRTQVIGDPLEWAGTGKEMFIGFLIVVVILAPLYLAFQFLIPALASRGEGLASALVLIGIYLSGIYLGAVGLFRALRYRLSRTYWRGIRGGSNEPGWTYGFKALGYTLVTIITGGLAYPWAKTRLWNLRWNEMSFGGLQFDADLDASGLFGRWIALYFAPIGVVIAASVVGGLTAMTATAAGVADGGIFVLLGLAAILAYLVIPLIFMAFWAKFYRNAAEVTDLGELRFGFDASTMQWIALWVGNIALAVFTLGFGIMFWTYRNWSFITRHLQIYGTVHVNELMQSQTRAPGDSEGLADAFDIGAI